MSKGIYKFEVSFRRGGSLDGCFVAEEGDIEKLRGKVLNFGEVDGKHSQVRLAFDKDRMDDSLTLVTEDASFIALFEKFGMSMGYNPIEYMNDQEEEEEEEDEEEEDEEEEDEEGATA